MRVREYSPTVRVRVRVRLRLRVREYSPIEPLSEIERRFG